MRRCIDPSDQFNESIFYLRPGRLCDGRSSSLQPSIVFAQAALPTGMSKEEAFGNVLKASKWERLNIEVCWENLESDDAPYRLIVRSAVEDTWQRYSKIKFEGWGKCAQDTPGIHIRISDEGPHTEALGRFLTNVPTVWSSILPSTLGARVVRRLVISAYTPSRPMNSDMP